MLAAVQPGHGLVNGADGQHELAEDAGVHRKQRHGEGEHQRPGNEVGQGGEHLHALLEADMGDFVEEDGEHHGQPAGDQVQAAHAEGVLQHADDVVPVALVGEHLREPLQPHKLLLAHGNAELVVVEGIAPAVQGQVAEQEHRQQEGQHHQEELVLLGQLLHMGKVGEERREYQQRQGNVQIQRPRRGAHDLGHLQGNNQPAAYPHRKGGQEQQNRPALVRVPQEHRHAQHDEQQRRPHRHAIGAGDAAHGIRGILRVQFALAGFFGVDGLALIVLGAEDILGGLKHHGLPAAHADGGQHLVFPGLGEGKARAGQQHHCQGHHRQEQRGGAHAAPLGNGVDEVGLVGRAHAQHAAHHAAKAHQQHQRREGGNPAHAQLAQLPGGGGEHVCVADGKHPRHRRAHQHQRQRAAHQREPAVHPGQEGKQRRKQQQHQRPHQIGVHGGGGGGDGEDAADVVRVGGIGLQRRQVAGQHLGKHALVLGQGGQVGLLARHFLKDGKGSVHGRRVGRGGGHRVRHGNHMAGEQHAQRGQQRQHAAQAAPGGVAHIKRLATLHPHGQHHQLHQAGHRGNVGENLHLVQQHGEQQ